VLKSLKTKYDAIVLPSTLSLLAENLFEAADAIAISVAPTTLCERTYKLITFFKNAATRPTT